MSRPELNKALAALDGPLRVIQREAWEARSTKGRAPWPGSSASEFDASMLNVVQLLASASADNCDRPWKPGSDFSLEEIRVAEAILRLLCYSYAKEIDVVSAIREAATGGKK